MYVSGTYLEKPRWRWLSIALGLMIVCSAKATSVPRISFEELTDKSEVIAQGQIARTWSGWDSAHKHIWTHYDLAVSATYKGQSVSAVTISEPGGVVGSLGELVAGAVTYAPGENVIVFLERMPNGYLRTTGWGQGHYRVDQRGIIHPSESLKAVDLVAGSSVSAPVSLEGMNAAELARRVTLRVRAGSVQ